MLNVELRRRRENGIYYARVSGNGGRTFLSLKTKDWDEAEEKARELRIQLDQQGQGVFQARKLTFNDLASDFLRDYEVNNRRSLARAQRSVTVLKGFFDQWLASNIKTNVIRVYVEKRQRAGIANGTINRELSALRRMFSLAVKAETLLRAPHIPMLEEAPARSGFFEREQFDAVLRHLPAEITPVARFGYELGWRVSEILGLQWRQVDLEARSVRLDLGATKNKEGRLAFLSPGLLQILKNQADTTRALERRQGIIIPYVFHRRGNQIHDFHKAWRRACRLAGVPGMLFHDLRRTAARNMVRAGIHEGVVMKITGHKKRSVFERYNITSEADLREAARKLGTYQHPGVRASGAIESHLEGG